MNCLKEYEKLNAIEGSPIMPHTYVTMILLSIIPSLFFKVVHPHLEKFKNKS
jgi:hypothetical protein